MAQDRIKQLIDIDVFHDLISDGVLNWWCDAATAGRRSNNSFCRPLFPAITISDGDCLIYSISLFIFGTPDAFGKLLRNLLYKTLIERENLLKNRWHDEMHKTAASYSVENRNALLSAAGLDREWKLMLEAASPAENRDIAVDKSLGSLHIFVLANILRRPIIILGERFVRNFGGDVLAPNDIRGIYLPCLWNHHDCVKSPIVIAYNRHHFSPLLTLETRLKNAAPCGVPLCDKEYDPLFYRYFHQREAREVIPYVKQYLDISELMFRPDIGIPVAKIELITPPDNSTRIQNLSTTHFSLFSPTNAGRSSVSTGMIGSNSDEFSPSMIDDFLNAGAFTTENPMGAQLLQSFGDSPLHEKCVVRTCESNGHARFGGKCGMHHFDQKQRDEILHRHRLLEEARAKIRLPGFRQHPSNTGSNLVESGQVGTSRHQPSSPSGRLRAGYHQPTSSSGVGDQEMYGTAIIARTLGEENLDDILVTSCKSCQKLGQYGRAMEGYCSACFKSKQENALQMMGQSQRGVSVINKQFKPPEYEVARPSEPFQIRPQANFANEPYPSLSQITSPQLRMHGRHHQELQQPQKQHQICPSPFCESYGNAAMGGYCSKCYEALRRTYESSTASYQAVPSAPPPSSSIPSGGDVVATGANVAGTTTVRQCPTPGCDRTGQVNLDGYCSVCYTAIEIGRGIRDAPKPSHDCRTHNHFDGWDLN